MPSALLLDDLAWPDHFRWGNSDPRSVTTWRGDHHLTIVEIEERSLIKVLVKTSEILGENSCVAGSTSEGRQRLCVS
jgi:hypothetical protein